MATTIYEDNQSAIAMMRNPQFHGRAKHIAIKFHFICEQMSNGMIKLEYCPTNQMLADMFTTELRTILQTTISSRKHGTSYVLLLK